MTQENQNPSPEQEQAAAEPAVEAAAETAAPITPEQEIAALNEKIGELQDNFLRAKAEGENIRRRAVEDIAKAHKFAIESFAEHLVPVTDSLYAALSTDASDAKAFKEGLEITLKQLLSHLCLNYIPSESSLWWVKSIIWKKYIENVAWQVLYGRQ